MSFVAAAIIAPQYIGASMAADATREGAAIAGDATTRASQLQMEMFRQATRTLQPFVNFGTAAGSSLASMSVSPAERKRQFELQRADLQAEVTRLQQPFEPPPPPGGKNSSERWAATAYALGAERKNQLTEAQTKLDAFNKRAELEMGQLDARQAEGIQASPLYEFQRDLGERNIKRQLAATGRQDTGFGMETLSNFYRALGAEETERQTGRLQFLTNVGANAAAGQATNAMNTGNTQATLTAQAGQLYGQGEMQAGQITGAGIQGVGKTATQVGMLALLAANSGMFSGGAAGADPNAGQWGYAQQGDLIQNPRQGVINIPSSAY